MTRFGASNLPFLLHRRSYSMENTERLIRTWVATEKDEEVKEMVAGTTSFHMIPTNARHPLDISADRTSLVNVVKGLGEYLTADEEDLRRKGRLNSCTLREGSSQPQI